MRKLLIAAAIVCVAVAAHANVINWLVTVGNPIPNPTGDTGLTGTMKVMCDEAGVSSDQQFNNGILTPKVATIKEVDTTLGHDYTIVLEGMFGDYMYSETITRRAKTDGYVWTLLADFSGGDNWTRVVPEPTSGLLLLLGVAGLALKRKSK